jgi:hypothetical protein
MFQPQVVAELGIFGHVVLALESSSLPLKLRKVVKVWSVAGVSLGGSPKRLLWNLPLRLSKTTEARNISEVFLHGGPERTLHEAVKTESGLPWRPQDVRDARTVRCLLKTLMIGSGTSPRERSVFQLWSCPAGLTLFQYFPTVLRLQPMVGRGSGMW